MKPTEIREKVNLVFRDYLEKRFKKIFDIKVIMALLCYIGMASIMTHLGCSFIENEIFILSFELSLGLLFFSEILLFAIFLYAMNYIKKEYILALKSLESLDIFEIYEKRNAGVA